MLRHEQKKIRRFHTTSAKYVTVPSVKMVFIQIWNVYEGMRYMTCCPRVALSNNSSCSIMSFTKSIQAHFITFSIAIRKSAAPPRMNAWHVLKILML